MFYLRLKIAQVAEWLTEERLQNVLIAWLFIAILCADSIVEFVCKLIGA